MCYYDIKKIWDVSNKQIPNKLEKKHPRKKASKANEKPNK